MIGKRTTFAGLTLPILLLLPQLAVTFVFFLLPTGQAVISSLLLEDAFGTRRQFVGLANFKRLFGDPTYLASIGTTLVFSLAVVALALGLGLLLAVLTETIVRGRTAYRTLLVWPYAVAPAVAGVLWWFMLHPTIGIAARGLHALGIAWDPILNGRHALILVIAAAAWKQVAYNYLFYLAGLQSIPKSLVEAAALDGAGAGRRFRHLILPLLMPTTFFLIVVNMIYAFCDTFGVVHATTGGGPGQATSILVFRVYRDGFEGLDLGGSAAQSVVLLAVVGLFTVLQFRYLDRRVTY
jgi:sn-glycerol 3-phosphate transport system permease protein